MEGEGQRRVMGCGNRAGGGGDFRLGENGLESPFYVGDAGCAGGVWIGAKGKGARWLVPPLGEW